MANTKTYRDLPVVGDGFSLLPSVAQTLICNWDGGVARIGGHPDQYPNIQTFEPVDKGLPRVYCTNSEGKVILSITLFYGTEDPTDGVEAGPHFSFEACSSTMTD